MDAKEKFIKEELQLYTTGEIAEILQSHTVTIRRYMREGRIKGKKIGKKWLVTKDNLKAFICGDK